MVSLVHQLPCGGARFGLQAIREADEMANATPIDAAG